MANYFVKTLKPWHDKDLNFDHQIGETCFLPKDRCQKIMSYPGYVEPLYSLCDGTSEPELKTVVCINSFAKVGGIEQSILNLVKTFPYQLRVLTSHIDAHWFTEIGEYANITVDKGRESLINADVVILTQFDSSVWLDKNIVGYKKVYQQVHADYGYYGKSFDASKWLNDSRIDKFLPVSENARDSLKRLYGKDGIYLENCMKVSQKGSKTLVFGYFGRATPEKNPEGIVKFVKRVNESGRKAFFIIASDMKYKANGLYSTINRLPNVYAMDASDTAIELLPKCDYLIQLSKGEASCEVVREALDNRVPVIVSNIPAFEYIEDGVHGYHLSELMEEEELERIFNEVPTITNKAWNRKTDIETWSKVLKGEL